MSDLKPRELGMDTSWDAAMDRAASMDLKAERDHRIRNLLESIHDPRVRRIVVIFCRAQINAEDFDRTLDGHWSKRDRECWIAHDMGRVANNARREFTAAREAVTREQLDGPDIPNIWRWVSNLNYSRWKRLLEECTDV